MPQESSCFLNFQVTLFTIDTICVQWFVLVDISIQEISQETSKLHFYHNQSVPLSTQEISYGIYLPNQSQGLKIFVNDMGRYSSTTWDGITCLCGQAPLHRNLNWPISRHILNWQRYGDNCFIVRIYLRKHQLHKSRLSKPVSRLCFVLICPI